MLVAHTCNLNYLETEIGMTKVQGWHEQTVLRTPSPKLPEQNGLEVWLKQQSPCLASRSPEFKAQSHKKKKKIPKTTSFPHIQYLFHCILPSVHKLNILCKFIFSFWLIALFWGFLGSIGDLDAGFHTCQAGALPFVSCLQFIFFSEYKPL
jgi:hypothetical protein